MCSKHMDGTEQIYKDLGSRVEWEDNEFHNHYDKQPKKEYGPTRYRTRGGLVGGFASRLCTPS